MKNREWYEKRLEGYSGDQKDIIRLLLDIRDTSFSTRIQQKFEELSDEIEKNERRGVQR